MRPRACRAVVRRNSVRLAAGRSRRSRSVRGLRGHRACAVQGEDRADGSLRDSEAVSRKVRSGRVCRTVSGTACVRYFARFVRGFVNFIVYLKPKPYSRQPPWTGAVEERFTLRPICRKHIIKGEQLFMPFSNLRNFTMVGYKSCLSLLCLTYLPIGAAARAQTASDQRFPKTY